MHNLSSSLAAMHFPALKLEELVFLSAASRPFQVDNRLELKKKRREKKKKTQKTTHQQTHANGLLELHIPSASFIFRIRFSYLVFLFFFY